MSAELEQRNRSLAMAVREFRVLFEEAPIGMAIVSLDGVFSSVNPRLAELVGRTREAVEGMTFQELTHPDDLADDEQLVAQLLSGELKRYELEKRYLFPDGTPTWIQLNVSLVVDAEGSPAHFIAQVQGIDERRRLQAELERLARQDGLTGLLNRRAFESEVEAHHRHCLRYGPRGALIVIDLDRFKTLNDHSGHLAGDAALRAVAEFLTQRVRTTDFIGRLGGDEFAVLLPEQTDEQARHVATKIGAGLRQALAEGWPASGRPPGASVGWAAWSASTMDPDQVLSEADRSMYERKRGPRPRASAAH